MISQGFEDHILLIDKAHHGDLPVQEKLHQLAEVKSRVQISREYDRRLLSRQEVQFGMADLIVVMLGKAERNEIEVMQIFGLFIMIGFMMGQGLDGGLLFLRSWFSEGSLCGYGFRCLPDTFMSFLQI